MDLSENNLHCDRNEDVKPFIIFALEWGGVVNQAHSLDVLALVDRFIYLADVMLLRRCERPGVHCKTSSGVCVFTTPCSRRSWPLERDDEKRGRWLVRESCASSLESDSYRCHVVIP